VLPRVLTLAQVETVIRNTPVEIEVFGFGSLCVMNEGRCWLSSYATGESPNTVGACSPAKYVQWEKSPGQMSTRLNGILIDRFGDDEPAGYPTLCKGRFEVAGETYYALEEPTSLNVLEILPEIAAIGVAAIKVEGRQRSPTYVAQVTRTLRAALDELASDPSTSTSSRPGRPSWRAFPKGSQVQRPGRLQPPVALVARATFTLGRHETLSRAAALLLAKTRGLRVLRRNGAEPGDRHHLPSARWSARAASRFASPTGWRWRATCAPTPARKWCFPHRPCSNRKATSRRCGAG
jgi:hypothetical protein